MSVRREEVDAGAAGGAFAPAVLPLALAAADALLFLLLDARGWRPGAAHAASFAAAALLAQGLDSRWRHRGAPRSVRLLRLGAVAIAVLALRGGSLGVLLRQAGLSPPLAIAPVALGAALAFELGCAFWVHGAERLGADSRWRLAALGAGAYVFALRLLYGGLADLVSDESYYWQYARHLDLGYLDHPPMVAWLIAGATAVAGDGELAVRLGAVLCGALTCVFAALLARDLFGAAAGWCAGLLAALLPYFVGAGSVMVPDAPLVAAWAAALFFLQRALLRGEGRAWWGAGACLGLGLLSKYTIALLGVAVVVFVLVDRPSRRWLRRVEPWGAALLAALLFAPVLYWNFQNDWVSFRFQSVRRMQGAWHFGLPELALDCALLVTPLVLAAALLELLPARRGGLEPETEEARRRRLFLGVALVLPLSVFALYALLHRATFHWTGPIWLAALPAAAHSMTAPGRTRLQRALRRSWAPTAAVLCAGYGLALHALVLELPRLPSAKLADRYYWSDAAPVLAEVGRELARETGRDPLFVGMSRWALASSLAYYAPDGDPDDVTSRHLFARTGGMYERWFPAERAAGRPVVLVGSSRHQLLGKHISRRLEGASHVQVRDVVRDGRRLRRVYYRTAARYLDR